MSLLQLLLYSLILSFCLGQFGKIPIGRGEVGMYLWDILAAALVFYWLALKLGVKKKLKLPPLWAPISIFSLISLITLINGSRWLGVGEWVVAFGYWVRWIIYAGVYFVVSDLSRKILNTKYQILNTLIASGVILALLGFTQLLIFPNLSSLDPALGWDPHQGRVVSTWLDPNFLGAYLVLCLSLLTGRLFYLVNFNRHPRNEFPSTELRTGGVGSKFATRHPELVSGSNGQQTSLSVRFRNKFGMTGRSVSLEQQSNFGLQILVLTTYYLILTTGLLLTFSRSAWAMFAIVIGVFGLFKSRKLLVFMVVIFFGAYFFVPRVQTRLAGITDPADSASLRLVSWQRTFEIIKKHPLMGVGFNAFRYAQEQEGFFRDKRGVPMTSGHAGAGSDSSLLLVWATTGIFGLLSYFWLYGSVIWKALSHFRHSELVSESPCHFESVSEFDGKILNQVQDDHNHHKFLSLTVLAALAGLLIESNFINSLFFPPILLWLWIVAGA